MAKKKAKKRRRKKKTDEQDPKLMKIAQLLHRAFEKRKLGAYESIFELWPELERHWADLRTNRRRLAKVEFEPTREGMRTTQRLLRQFRGHANSLQQTSGYIVDRTDTCTNQLGRQMRTVSDDSGLPTLTDCYKQLEALQREFDTCKLSEKEDEILVTTQEVQLRKLFFGRYYIHISLAAIAADDRGFYHIKPVSKACPMYENHYHPHLDTGGGLCEGRGEDALTKAFNDGRLYDCCMLINNIMCTAGGHPYVELRYFPRPGSASGVAAEEEDLCVCESCAQEVTDEEYFVCENCGDGFCRACMHLCETSNHWVCNGCLEDLKESEEACRDNCIFFGGTSCDVKTNDSCSHCDQVYADSQLAKCDASDRDPLCRSCASTLALDRQRCEDCENHGLLGCALTKHGYPILNTVNHPAYVEARGQMHSHHHFQMHPVSLSHTDDDTVAAQIFAERRAYYRYLDHRATANSQDHRRVRQRGMHTMSRRQRAAMTGEGEDE
jgi:hypothetical protein